MPIKIGSPSGLPRSEADVSSGGNYQMEALLEDTTDCGYEGRHETAFAPAGKSPAAESLNSSLNGMFLVMAGSHSFVDPDRDKPDKNLGQKDVWYDQAESLGVRWHVQLDSDYYSCPAKASPAEH